VNQRVFPQLRMTSWQRSRQFYVAGLGFHVDWEHRFEPRFSVFTQLTRDGLSLSSPSTPATVRSVAQHTSSSTMSMRCIARSPVVGSGRRSRRKTLRGAHER
jgi:hypothetical protein